MYKVKIYVDHGYFEYEVGSDEQALAHGEAIMKNRVYRRVNESNDVEFWPVYKVKITGPDLGSEYKDKFKRT